MIFFFPEHRGLADLGQKWPPRQYKIKKKVPGKKISRGRAEWLEGDIISTVEHVREEKEATMTSSK